MQAHRCSDPVQKGNPGIMEGGVMSATIPPSSISLFPETTSQRPILLSDVLINSTGHVIAGEVIVRAVSFPGKVLS